MGRESTQQTTPDLFSTNEVRESDAEAQAKLVNILLVW
jgi:hypothetical protein